MDLENGTPPRQNRRPGSKPKFVELHPNDRKGDGLDDVFYEDPRTFVPPKNAFGEVQSWGIYPYWGPSGYPDPDYMGMSRRWMIQQMNYAPHEKVYKYEKPELQFVNALIERKKKALDKVDMSDLQKRDYVLRIHLRDVPFHPRPESMLFNDTDWGRDEFGEELIYRRFKVSGGTNLDTLQDKVITPIMGWARNAHAFVFIDHRDGACFGPRDSRAIDFIHHADKICHTYVNADEYTLAHLVEQDGAKVDYVYDFGDKWVHVIEVERILPTEESDGRVTVLEGRGMCPCEDAGSPRKWAAKIWNYTRGTPRQQNEVFNEIRGAPNYKGKVRSRGEFDPFAFSLEDTRSAVRDALASKSSVRVGPKMVTTPLSPEALHDPSLIGGYGKVKKGQAFSREFEDGALSYQSEIVNMERRDRMSRALCALCGNPNDLKACAACKKVWYCGREHQRSDWKAHKQECKAK